MSNVPCTRSEGLLMSMSSVTETSTSDLGKQGRPTHEGSIGRNHESKLPCLPRSEVLVSVTEDIDMSKPSDLVQGTLDMLLLKILALAPMNGFAVSQRLKKVSGDVLQVSDGSLYPALHKLEQ